MPVQELAGVEDVGAVIKGEGSGEWWRWWWCKGIRENTFPRVYLVMTADVIMKGCGEGGEGEDEDMVQVFINTKMRPFRNLRSEK